MRHGDVRNVLEEARVCGNADEELELGVSGARPEEGDDGGEDDGAHWVDPPLQFAAEDAGHETEAVNEEVVPMVFPENADLGVLVPQGPAVEEEAEFRGESYRNRDDGG